MNAEQRCPRHLEANNESSEVVGILLPVTFYSNPSTRLDNVKHLWRFVISHLEPRMLIKYIKQENKSYRHGTLRKWIFLSNIHMYE